MSFRVAGFSGLLLLILLAIFYLSSPLALRDSVTLQAAGLKTFTVASLEGDVRYQKQGSERWRQAYLGLKLSTGDLLQTGRGGFARLICPKRADVLVKASTTLEVGQLEQLSSGFSLKLLVGRILVQVEKLGQALQNLLHFKVQTPTALAGVRGTIFGVTVSTDGTTEVAVLQGLVSVVGKDKSVEVPAGYASEVLPGDHPARPVRNKHTYLQDELERRWLTKALKKEIKKNKKEQSPGKGNGKTDPGLDNNGKKAKPGPQPEETGSGPKEIGGSADHPHGPSAKPQAKKGKAEKQDSESKIGAGGKK